MVDRFGIEPKFRGWETYKAAPAPAQVGRSYPKGHRCLSTRLPSEFLHFDQIDGGPSGRRFCL